MCPYWGQLTTPHSLWLERLGHLSHLSLPYPLWSPEVLWTLSWLSKPMLGLWVHQRYYNIMNRCSVLLNHMMMFDQRTVTINSQYQSIQFNQSLWNENWRHLVLRWCVMWTYWQCAFSSDIFYLKWPFSLSLSLRPTSFAERGRRPPEIALDTSTTSWSPILTEELRELAGTEQRTYAEHTLVLMSHWNQTNPCKATMTLCCSCLWRSVSSVCFQKSCPWTGSSLGRVLGLSGRLCRPHVCRGPPEAGGAP